MLEPFYYRAKASFSIAVPRLRWVRKKKGAPHVRCPYGTTFRGGSEATRQPSAVDEARDARPPALEAIPHAYRDASHEEQKQHGDEDVQRAHVAVHLEHRGDGLVAHLADEDTAPVDDDGQKPVHRPCPERALCTTHVLALLEHASQREADRPANVLVEVDVSRHDAQRQPDEQEGGGDERDDGPVLPAPSRQQAVRNRDDEAEDVVHDPQEEGHLAPRFS